jgi:toxin YhaV
MSVSQPFPVVINGWTVFAHPLFLAQLEALTSQVEHIQKKDPVAYVTKNASKRLAAIAKLVFDVVPQDPTRAEFRQGDTLGEEHKHWLKAKFYQQYRLFFRYHAQARVIVFAWVNDEDSKRVYERGDDAYRLFRKNRTDFILDAARAAAEETLLDRALMAVSPEAYADFVARLDRAPAPNPRLLKTLQTPAPWDER